MPRFGDIRSISLALAIFLASELSSERGAVFAQQASQLAAEGEVVMIQPGVIYLGGFPHKLVSLKTADGVIDVAVPATGMLPVQVGENLVASGRAVAFRGRTLIDPREGYVYRAADKEMGQVMAEMQSRIQAQTQAQTAPAAASSERDADRATDKEMAQAMAEVQSQIQAQTQAQTATAAASGEPDAVPIRVLESSRQQAEREAQRTAEATNQRLNLLIGILSLLVAIVAIDRRPHVLKVAAQFVSATLRRASQRLDFRRR